VFNLKKCYALSCYDMCSSVCHILVQSIQGLNEK